MKRLFFTQFNLFINFITFFYFVLKLFNYSKYGDDSLGSYTIVWSKNVDDEQVLFRNETLVEQLRASKIRLIMNGYYSSLKDDIRQLYYSITELKVRGR